VRAALAIPRALSELKARNRGKAPELAARIGLDSGPVVVDASGEVFGEAPNAATHVQGEAEPGTVLVSVNVERQTAGLFVAEDKGARELKGVTAPVTLFRIVRASGGGRRGRAKAPSPLVGRAEELDLLMRRWERALSGQGQFLQIVGEPGIGKSGLIEEFHARLGETPHAWAKFSSSQPCTRSRNGAACASAAPRRPWASASPTSRTHSNSSASTPLNMRRSRRRSWKFLCRRIPRRNSGQRNCVASSARR
jgi:hypothetical protein